MIVRELISRFGFKVDKKGFKKAKSSFSTLKKGAAAAVAAVTTGAIAVGVKKILDLGSSANETLNVLEATFGGLSTAIIDWAKTTSREVGRSEFQLREFAATTGAMLAPMLGSKEQAADMSKEIAKLSIDLGSFFNVMDDEALLALKAGLIGSSEPMRRFGVVMTVATLDAFALSQGLGKTTKQMSEGEKVALRYKFILEKTKDAQGDAAKTAKGYANASKALSSSISSVFTRLGKLLIPQAEKSVDSMLNVVRAIEDWIDVNEVWLQQRIDEVFGVISTAGNFLWRVLRGVYWAAKLILSPIFSLMGLLLDINPIILALAAALLLPIAPWILWAALIAALTEDFVLWWTEGDKAITGMGELDKRFGGLLGTLKDLIKSDDPEKWSKAWQGAIDAIKGFFKDMSVWIKDILSPVIQWVEDKLATLISALPSAARKALGLDTPKEKGGEKGNIDEIVRRKQAAIRAQIKANKLARAATTKGQVATAASKPGGSVAQTNTNTVVVNVESKPGQSPQELGEAVGRVVDQKLEANNRKAVRALSPATATAG